MMINKKCQSNEINSLNQQGLITVPADLSTALFLFGNCSQSCRKSHNNAKPAESIRLISVKSNSMRLLIVFAFLIKKKHVVAIMVTTCCGIAPPIIGELSYHYFGLNPTLTQSFAYLLNVTGAAADF